MSGCSHCWSDGEVIGSGFGMGSHRGSSYVPEHNNDNLLVNNVIVIIVVFQCNLTSRTYSY